MDHERETIRKIKDLEENISEVKEHISFCTKELKEKEIILYNLKEKLHLGRLHRNYK